MYSFAYKYVYTICMYACTEICTYLRLQQLQACRLTEYGIIVMPPYTISNEEIYEFYYVECYVYMLHVSTAN